MKKVTLNWYVLVAVALGIIVLTLGTPKVVNSVREKRQAVQDSITELNQLWKEARQQNITTTLILDSLSRTGDSIVYTNLKNQNFTLKLIPRK